MDLDFADGGVGGGKGGGLIAGPVPAVAVPPLLLPALYGHGYLFRGGGRGVGGDGAGDGGMFWDLVLREAGDVVVGEHAVVDAELVDVAAAVDSCRSSRRPGAR